MTPRMATVGIMAFLAVFVGLVLFIPGSVPQRPERDSTGEFTMHSGGTYDLVIDGKPHRCVGSKRSTTCRPFAAGEWR